MKFVASKSALGFLKINTRAFYEHLEEPAQIAAKIKTKKRMKITVF
jgi:hypothetical protein